MEVFCFVFSIFNLVTGTTFQLYNSTPWTVCGCTQLHNVGADESLSIQRRSVYFLLDGG